MYDRIREYRWQKIAQYGYDYDDYPPQQQQKKVDTNAAVMAGGTGALAGGAMYGGVDAAESGKVKGVAEGLKERLAPIEKETKSVKKDLKGTQAEYQSLKNRKRGFQSTRTTAQKAYDKLPWYKKHRFASSARRVKQYGKEMKGVEKEMGKSTHGQNVKELERLGRKQQRYVNIAGKKTKRIATRGKMGKAMAIPAAAAAAYGAYQGLKTSEDLDMRKEADLGFGIISDAARDLLRPSIGAMGQEVRMAFQQAQYKLLQTKYKQVFAGIMRRDPILSEYPDKASLEEAYKVMIKFAPNLAAEPLVARSFLRYFAQNDGVIPEQQIDRLVQAENKYVNQK